MSAQHAIAVELLNRSIRRDGPKDYISTWWVLGASAQASPLHRESRVDALILVNDMTSFQRDKQQLVHTGASMQVRQGSVGKAAAERFPTRAWDHELQGIRL